MSLHSPRKVKPSQANPQAGNGAVFTMAKSLIACHSRRISIALSMFIITTTAITLRAEAQPSSNRNRIPVSELQKLGSVSGYLSWERGQLSPRT